MKTNAEEPRLVVFFDGHCLLCDGFVQFLLPKKTDPVIYFAPLQGATAKTLLSPADSGQTETVVFKNETQIFHHSTAVLRVCLYLPFPWAFLSSLALLIPRGLRDSIYRFVARHRYQWFGRNEVCRMPSPEDLGRILP
ncbi:MAG: thiol-disulfide oxidoreductase DCC [Bdellovibrio sp. CG10_big_fil_rev_8_21_14_0_10_47_8]|nr:MAG: thiol-disulfide oxidoreductase DCC [Bdellovibrio sp. CG10_big_fil_rev_8_21_14_0_10_47_8]